MNEHFCTKYALWHKKRKQLVGFYTSSSEGDYCVDVEHILNIFEPDTWTVDNKAQAEYVKENQTPWYNASYETPNHNFTSDELEVVEIKLTFQTEV